MDLGQQSNLGSLVSAVLVGLLALASNQYMRMDRVAMKSFLDGIQARRSVTEHSDVANDRSEQEVSKVAARITKLESELSILFEKWKQGSIRTEDPRLRKMWKAIHELQENVDGDEQLRQNLPVRASIDLVWILFRAAEMNPREFSEVFLSRSQELATHDNQSVGAQAAVLRIYHGYDRSNPDETRLSQKLETFARANPEEMVGIFLYLIICRDLYETGHADISERILRRGIQIYSGLTDNVGRLKLINELMDQQMGK